MSATEPDYSRPEDVLEAWQEAATAAFMRVMEESGKTRTQIAADMDVSLSSIDRYQAGRWSLDGVLKLAKATAQHPVRMLGREALP